MNNVIISLGCSFLAGVGNWHTPTHRKWEQNKVHINELHKNSYNSFLNYSIGTQLARNLNFDEHHNFAIGGSSIKHQLHFFHRRYKAETFKDKNVLFYLGITYPQRNCTFVDNKLRTIHLDQERKNDFYNEYRRISEERILKDSIQNQLVYIESIRTLCKANNWHLILQPMVHDKTYYYKEQLIDINSNPKEIWVDKWLPPLDDKYLAHCGHPNIDGYKIWADKLVEYLGEQSELNIPISFHTKTIYCKDYNEDVELEAKRDDFKPSPL